MYLLVFLFVYFKLITIKKFNDFTGFICRFSNHFFDSFFSFLPSINPLWGHVIYPNKIGSDQVSSFGVYYKFMHNITAQKNNQKKSKLKSFLNHTNLYFFSFFVKLTACFGGYINDANECKARKVISVVYEFFVLQCTVFGL